MFIVHFFTRFKNLFYITSNPSLPPPDCAPGDWKWKTAPDRCNVLPVVDKEIYGCNHLYDAINCFDPESLMTIGTVNLNLMLGLHAGLLVKYLVTTL